METTIAPTPRDQSALKRHMRLRSATALVIANMIGAGIFTTTGFQAADLRNPMFIFVLWVIGGTLALLGALCYAELGAMMPKAGIGLPLYHHSADNLSTKNLLFLSVLHLTEILPDRNFSNS